MGVLTSEHPKCMTEVSPNETILSRQLNQLVDFGVKEVVMTTGPLEDVLVNYCESLDLPIEIKYVNNPKYKETNYCFKYIIADEAQYLKNSKV